MSPNRVCTLCQDTVLHHDNKSGICRACKKNPPVVAAPTAARTRRILCVTAKDPAALTHGHDLTVYNAVKDGATTTAAVAIAIAPAIKKSPSKQDAKTVARWHTWHLVKEGYVTRVAA